MDKPIAKLQWKDPTTDVTQVCSLHVGETLTIGRSSSCDLFIKEEHISRRHAQIEYQQGVFLISDIGSANGVFVNNLRVTDPLPLVTNDEIYLYHFPMRFVAADEITSEVTTPYETTNQQRLPGVFAHLEVLDGVHQGVYIPVVHKDVHIGRATSNARWEIVIADRSISRPHAQLKYEQGRWVLFDLNSANGTFVNDHPVDGSGHIVTVDDYIALGNVQMRFRAAQTNTIT